MSERIVFLVTVVGAMGAALAQDASEYNAAGVEHYKAGEWDQAIEYFELAHEMASDNETVRRNLCNAYQSAANELAQEALYREATQHLVNAISVDPHNAAPLIQLGSYYLRLDMVSDAVFRLEEAVELAPDNLDANELLGDAYYRDNDLAAACVNWEWVIEKDPNRPGLLRKIEKARREQGVKQNFRQDRLTPFRSGFPAGCRLETGVARVDTPRARLPGSGPQLRRRISRRAPCK